MNLIQEAIAPGKYLVDYIPICKSTGRYEEIKSLDTNAPSVKHLPKWTPFVSFKREAESYRKQITDFVRRPFEHVKADMVHA